MAASGSIISPRFESDKEDGDKEEKERQRFVQEGLEQADKWGATGVDVDRKTVEGRKSNRGFTISMGKSAPTGDDEADDSVARTRSTKRAQTLPAMSTRRADFALSEASQQKLTDMQAGLVARQRRGSVGLAIEVVTDVTLEACWQEVSFCHSHGKLSEGQAHGDEREWLMCVSSEFPVKPPPIISCQKGSKGLRDTTPNQDNFSVTYFKNGWTLACAFDGHGPFGHLVSTRTVQTVPYFLCKSEHWPDKMEAALIEAFEQAQRDVVAAALAESWDVQASGSTAVAACWKGNKIWTANCGDSRCVVGTETNRSLLFETMDHKPDNAKEKERIENSGGEVRTQTYPDGWVNHRIFVRGEDYPGLCMSRTLGDESVKAHGVIATPEVESVEVDMSKQPFFILSSDGVWEFLDSQFVVKAVAKKIQSDGPEKTVHKLQREARKRWRQEEGDYCDDITSILIQMR
eukprot:TRINITY_DN1252_c0_g1_i1.p1 TRINITY_DN1252_c0_g1~~TRINITY_DN1252_c0_g1_i1.p1  ORF type:complete len:486 (-),score=96.18 TRINITY_DN1252_c0_g1_i1:85-1467(-)